MQRKTLIIAVAASALLAATLPASAGGGQVGFNFTGHSNCGANNACGNSGGVGIIGATNGNGGGGPHMGGPGWFGPGWFGFGEGLGGSFGFGPGGNTGLK